MTRKEIPSLEEFAQKKKPSSVAWMEEHKEALAVFLENRDAPKKLLCRYLHEYYDYPFARETMETLRSHYRD